MGILYDVVDRFLRQDDWPVSSPKPGVLVTAFEGTNGRFSVYGMEFEDKDRFCFYALAPVNCPPERFGAMSEFLHRANHGLTLGCFEINYDGGEIRFRTSIDVQDAELTGPLVRNLIYSCCMVMDTYLPGIFGLIHGGLSAEQAILKVERVEPEN